MIPVNDAHRYIERLGYSLHIAGTTLGVEWSLFRKGEEKPVAQGIEDNFTISIRRATDKVIELEKGKRVLVDPKHRVCDTFGDGKRNPNKDNDHHGKVQARRTR